MAAKFGLVFRVAKLYLNVGVQRIAGVFKDKIPYNNLCFQVGQANKVTIMYAIVYCKASLDNPDQQENNDSYKLSNEEMINEAYHSTMDSVTKLLNVSSQAVINANKNYRQTLKLLISLQSQILESPKELQFDLEYQVFSARAKMYKAKEILQVTNSNMSSVCQLAFKMSDVSFLAGAEKTCFTMMERINAAYVMILIEQDKTKKLEDSYLEFQGCLISETQ